jgi:hypothetical protein
LAAAALADLLSTSVLGEYAPFHPSLKRLAVVVEQTVLAIYQSVPLLLVWYLEIFASLWVRMA